MLKNITLSAEQEQIERARKKARATHSTLNAEFRRWLETYASKHRSADHYAQLMRELGHIEAGRKFTREEMNER